ncbi:hypothetical protein PRK78_004142 [Emydomyces testavorans]|uniref:Uncharacterized protein n=1 Tax=Emydomyces testavorans TaxID=2070801 RepID=A0AAF0DHB3_9EURO|nr:hypothetical protein PRK78_004142 [Emydomyces testavorans]
MTSTRFPSSRVSTRSPSSQLTAQLEQSQAQGGDPVVAIDSQSRNSPREDAATSPIPEESVESSSRCSTPLQARPFNKKADNGLIGVPATPQRNSHPAHGLSLHVPHRLFNSQSNTPNRAPVSPKLESTQIYTSPSSVLPRRSRGLDFSRASTNLHHSTLAEASPDSSPVVGARGVSIPQRRAGNGCGFASPNNHIWSASGYGDRNAISSSVSSINMLDSDSSSCSDDDDDASLLALERGEPVITPSQATGSVQSLSNAASPNVAQIPAADWMHGLSKPSLMSFQRARYRSRTRHNSTSTSGNSSRPSPGPKSPSVGKNIETFPSGYFSKEAIMADVKSRRESLSLGTSDLHLSDMSDGEPKHVASGSSAGSLGGGSNPEFARRGVIRRTVTRRGNLLPKTKNFARIKAALLEEGAPIESEAKKEAEVIRQVRESDTALPPLSPSLIASAMPVVSDSEDKVADTTVADTIPSTNFSQQATENSGGAQFWNSFDHQYQTAPTSTYKPKDSVSDTMMETPTGNSTSYLPRGGSAFIQPRPLGRQALSSQAASELSQRLTKRRRVDDLDLDLASFKRRAVSPGTSAQSSPSQTQAFSFSESSQSGQLSKAKLGPTSTQSTSSGHSQPVKRVGLQGMNETNEGFMNMSID